jgi:hypothetical protein
VSCGSRIQAINLTVVPVALSARTAFGEGGFGSLLENWTLSRAVIIIIWLPPPYSLFVTAQGYNVVKAIEAVGSRSGETSEVRCCSGPVSPVSGVGLVFVTELNKRNCTMGQVESSWQTVVLVLRGCWL